MAQVRIEGPGRADGGIDGGTSEHRRDILRDLGERHDGSQVRVCGMRELFQRGESLFRGEVQNPLMSLDDLKIEGHHPIEQSLVGRKPCGMLRLIVQALSDRRGGLCHARYFSFFS